mmetsp:Transcript_131913/g.246671  ORF Transcript_131913/g.246671 Transcript_131913/m.246671 type:complete len:471 (+) Transcript_131913:84-1496(+)
MDSGTHPSDDLSRLLGLSPGDGMSSLEGSSSMRVAGDYYRDPDDITRGTVMAMGSGPGEGFNSAFLQEADFYAPEDKVVRGVTFEPAMGDHFGLDAPFGFGGLGDAGFALDPKSKSFASSGFSTDILGPKQTPGSTFGTPYFLDGDCPFAPPDDEFWEFSATTLHFTCGAVYTLGNRLLDFFTNEVTASVTKVTRTKFAIKADVFIDNVMCNTKVRVWKEASPNQFAVEFQRRGGDVRTFNCVYQRASQYLQPHFTAVGDAPPTFSEMLLAPPPLPLSPFPLSKGDATSEIGPLIDMAAQVNNLPIQAESASMLANLAADEQKAAAMCTPETNEALTTLMNEDATEVALPTAKVMLALSKTPAAIPFFITMGQDPASTGFLDLCIEKIRARLACTLVRRDLAEAVANAIDACAAPISFEKIKNLTVSISAAMAAISKERGVPQDTPGAAADLDAMDQSLRRAATRLAMQR